MATAFKRGLDEVFNDLKSLLRRDESGAQAQDVRIVVLPGKGCSLDVVHQSGTDSGNLVGSDADTDTRRADEDAEVGLARGHLAGHRLSVVGIISRFGAVGSFVEHMKAHPG